MAIYFTLGTAQAAPIDGASRWNGRDKVREGFHDETKRAAAQCDPDLGQVYLIQVEGRLASGPLT